MHNKRPDPIASIASEYVLLRYGIRLTALFLYITLHTSAISAEGFSQIQTKSGHALQLVEYPATPLPKSSLQAGIYQYELDDGFHTGKLGVFNGDSLFYVESTRKNPNEGQYGLSGSAIYGVYNNYLLVDASMGGTSRNGLIFLLKFDEKEIKLLDVIGQAYVNKRQVTPMIDFYGYKENPYDPKFPAFTKIEDVDHDGNPDIKIIISTDFQFNPLFAVYFSIINDRLSINFNPDLYIGNFKNESVRVGAGNESDAFYIYGVLSNTFEFSDMKNKLALNDKYKNTLEILGNLEKLDVSFHDVGGDIFVVKTFNFLRK